MNEFVEASEKLSTQLVPILTVVLLVCLIILLINLIKVVRKASSTLNKADGTIDLVDKSIEKIQAPLDTVVKVSKTVETVHDGAVKAVNDAKEFVEKNVDNIKKKIVKEEETINDPNPDDVIGE